MAVVTSSIKFVLTHTFSLCSVTFSRAMNQLFNDNLTAKSELIVDDRNNGFES